MRNDIPRTVDEVVRGGSKVFLRCDCNVPLDDRGSIADDFRIRSVIPAIRALHKQGASVVMGTHLGDPKEEHTEALSTKIIAKRLGELLSLPVSFSPTAVGPDAREASSALKSGEVLVLENLRFYGGEKQNDESFAKELASLADCYVNEAFSASHREHASIVGVPAFLPSAIGPLFCQEVRALSALLDAPARPMVAVIGGNKLQSKLGVVERLLEVADNVLLGNMLAAEAARGEAVFLRQKKLVLPVDGFPSNENALDIGVETRKKFCDILGRAKTVFWAGPLGKVEEDAYTQGSLDVARCIASSGAFSVIGGGDLGAFVRGQALERSFSHVSTGGGAMLTYIGEGDLPGLRAVREGRGF
ncbi:MAG: phosphoglycerate kinase [Candidatus Wildermuthbacteria bacterium]|nr:phosphoglycerate kinase [Candidatus Wildermuthbacteria bacterium]